MLTKQAEIVSWRRFHIGDRRVREAHSKDQFNAKKGHFPSLTSIATQNTTAQILSQNWVTVLNFLGIAALEHK